MSESLSFRRFATLRRARFPRRWLAGSRVPRGPVRHCAASVAPERAVPLVTGAATGVPGVTVGRAGPDDLAAAVAMHARCSAETLTRRYHGPVGEADRYLRHLLDPRHGVALAARAADGTLVALGHVLWDGEDTEVALLVEDAWQRRGVGAALLRQLIGVAARSGRRHVYAVTQASNAGMLAAMRATGLPLECERAEGSVVLTAQLGPLLSRAPVSGLRAGHGGRAGR